VNSQRTTMLFFPRETLLGNFISFEENIVFFKAYMLNVCEHDCLTNTDLGLYNYKRY
ncbi:hypothetical protein L9F63_002229, partial [Diploptera punctata]